MAVEGLDGSGKSTLIAGVIERCAGRRDVHEFRLPDPDVFGGGDLIRLLARDAPAPSAEVLALGFAANRLASYEGHIAPWLAGHPCRIALSHRYVLSGLAYQGADGVPLSWLVALNERVPAPDLTVFLDTDPSVCEKRVGERGPVELFESRFDRMREAFLAAIDLLTAHGWRIEILDGGASPAALVDRVAELLARLEHRG